MDQIKQDLSDIRSDVRLLNNKVDANHESLRRSIIKIDELLEKHNKTLYGNGDEGITTKVKVLEHSKGELKDHVLSDRWLHGTLVTIQIGILLKLFWPH